MTFPTAQYKGTLFFGKSADHYMDDVQCERTFLKNRDYSLGIEFTIPTFFQHLALSPWGTEVFLFPTAWVLLSPATVTALVPPSPHGLLLQRRKVPCFLLQHWTVTLQTSVSFMKQPTDEGGGRRHWFRSLPAPCKWLCRELKV